MISVPLGFCWFKVSPALYCFYRRSLCSTNDMSSGLSKAQRKRLNQSKAWKQDIPAEDVLRTGHKRCEQTVVGESAVGDQCTRR